MEMIPVKSSNIESIGYDKEISQLNVKFKNGKSFMYEEVLEHEFEGLVSAESVGKNFSAYIKPLKFAHEITYSEVDSPSKDEIIAEQARQIKQLKKAIKDFVEAVSSEVSGL